MSKVVDPVEAQIAELELMERLGIPRVKPPPAHEIAAFQSRLAESLRKSIADESLRVQALIAEVRDIIGVDQHLADIGEIELETGLTTLKRAVSALNAPLKDTVL
jgi:hypothetical protein